MESGTLPGFQSEVAERVARELINEIMHAEPPLPMPNKQVRTLLANLATNAALRRELLLGARHPADVARATPEQLAPKSVQLRRQSSQQQRLEVEERAAREHEDRLQSAQALRRRLHESQDRDLTAAVYTVE